MLITTYFGKFICVCPAIPNLSCFSIRTTFPQTLAKYYFEGRVLNNLKFIQDESGDPSLEIETERRQPMWGFSFLCRNRLWGKEKLSIHIESSASIGRGKTEEREGMMIT